MNATLAGVRSWFVISPPAAILELPKKVAVIRLRWPVVILCSYLLLYANGGWLDPVMVQGLLLLYVFSNAALYWVDEEAFSSSYFYGPLVWFDLVILIAAMSLSGHAGTDFYVACFLTIALCGICKDFRGWIIITLLSPLVYGYYLLQAAERMDPIYYLQVPLPLVVALFYGYFVQVENFDRTIAEQAGRAAERRRAEEKIRSELLERIRQQAAQIEQSNRLKDEFLNTMSHELRTPLNVIMGYAGMIKDGLLGGVNAEQDRSLRKILGRSEDLLAMISGILQAASLEAGVVVADNQPVSLSEFVRELQSDCEAPPGREVALVWDYPVNLPTIRTDKDKLGQILAHLIRNALKFTLQGQVTVRAQHLPLERKVRFQVSDTGIGIPQDSLALIFGKFYQADNAETRINGGVGLGLYLAKRLVELLGGTVEVESEPGKGSIFTVTLPA